MGRYKIEGTIRVRKLASITLIKLITENRLKDVAKSFNVKPSFLSLELKRRNLFRPNKRSVTTNPNHEKYLYTPNEDEMLDFGCWMNSKERIAIKQYIKINTIFTN